MFVTDVSTTCVEAIFRVNFCFACRKESQKRLKVTGHSQSQLLDYGTLSQKSGLQFDNWLFGPEAISRLSRNRPLVSLLSVLAHDSYD